MRRSRRACPYSFVGLPHLGFVTIVAPSPAGGAPAIVLEVRNFGLGVWNDHSFGAQGSIAGYEPRRQNVVPPQQAAMGAPAGAGFLISPLSCGDPACRTRYPDPYTPGMMNSVLDHSLVQGRNGFWQFGTVGNAGGDGVVIAFNGESARGPAKPSDQTCIGGAILLRPAPGMPPMTNGSGCGENYASYDEHSGYDYRAAFDTPVRAAAAGRVLNLAGERCYRSNIAGRCDDWGYVGIDHGSGYITQYGHLSRIFVQPGQRVAQGETIGRSGHTAPGPLGDHLHFEVLRQIGEDYLVVDPYGWVGSGNDPLYSARRAPPRNLWTREGAQDGLKGQP